MLLIKKLLPQGEGLAPALIKRAAVLTLPFGHRQHHEADLSDGQGTELGMRLPVGSTLRGGDVLVAEDGSILRVEAAPEPVLAIRAPADDGDLSQLLQLAHQLGELRLPMQAAGKHLLVQGSSELAQWLERQGFVLAAEEAPFDPPPLLSQLPEVQAHAHEHHHEHGEHCGHDHHHHHGCGHDHSHEHHHASEPAATGHVHGPGCGHDH